MDDGREEIRKAKFEKTIKLKVLVISNLKRLIEMEYNGISIIMHGATAVRGEANSACHVEMSGRENHPYTVGRTQRNFPRIEDKCGVLGQARDPSITFQRED
jgi:hypothetical protein